MTDYFQKTLQALFIAFASAYKELHYYPFTPDGQFLYFHHQNHVSISKSSAFGTRGFLFFYLERSDKQKPGGSSSIPAFPRNGTRNYRFVATARVRFTAGDCCHLNALPARNNDVE